MNATINESAEQPASPLTRWRFVWPTLCCAVIIGAGLIAYCDSFDGPFIFDDSGFSRPGQREEACSGASWPGRGRSWT